MPARKGKWKKGNVILYMHAHAVQCEFAAEAAFNQPLNSTRVGSATIMSYMFYSAKEFNQPLDSWQTTRVHTRRRRCTVALHCPVRAHSQRRCQIINAGRPTCALLISVCSCRLQPAPELVAGRPAQTTRRVYLCRGPQSSLAKLLAHRTTTSHRHVDGSYQAEINEWVCVLGSTWTYLKVCVRIRACLFRIVRMMAHQRL